MHLQLPYVLQNIDKKTLNNSNKKDKFTPEKV